MSQSSWLPWDRALVLTLVFAAFAATGCATVPTPRAPDSTGVVFRDSLRPTVGDTSQGLVPAGYGTLRQEEVAIRLRRLGVQMLLTPLDERVIRLLSPDAYRRLHELAESHRTQLAAIERRTPSRSLSVWMVSFYGLEFGEGRFSPLEFNVRNVGRDFRPLDLIPLTKGFGENRLRQRETQSALYAFDGQLDVTQPLTVSYESATSTEWANVLQILERERSLVAVRASRR